MKILLIKEYIKRQTIDYKVSASGQDDDIGRHGSPLCTTTSKLQLKHRTTITQECQKLS